MSVPFAFRFLVSEDDRFFVTSLGQLGILEKTVIVVDHVALLLLNEIVEFLRDSLFELVCGLMLLSCEPHSGHRGLEL